MGGFFREPMGIQRGNIGLTKFEFLFFIKIDFLKVVILIPRATPGTQVGTNKIYESVVTFC